LEIAFHQAAVATVAEYEGRLVGYQISTGTPIGGHLARLAVLPNVQGKGIGYALLYNLLSQFAQRGSRTITVNTQRDNLASLSLYHKAGFQLTGEEYPIYQLELHASSDPSSPFSTKMDTPI
jgi:ribosomal protein S18 acetylase RimI-like enzyme